METWCIDQEQLEQWATFSGDWNTIHFDRQAALRMGAADIVVHGMIPTILAQDHVSRRTLDAAPGSWRLCRVRMKRPLLRDRPARFSVSPAPGGLRFSVSSGAEELHLTGTIGPHEEGLLGAAAVGAGPSLDLLPITLGKQEVHRRAAEFAQVFPSVESSWVCLSGILFSAFLRRDLRLLQEASARERAKAEDYAQDVVAVQTTHSVRFDSGHFAARLPAGLGVCTCAFRPVRIFRVQGGWSAECSFAVRHEDCYVMEIVVGVLLKVTQPSSQGER